MMTPAMFAVYLCNKQPRQVQSRLLQDKAFSVRFGLMPRDVVTIGDDVQVDLRAMLIAIRQTLTHREATALQDLKGHEVLITLEQGQLLVTFAAKNDKAHLDDFMFLSPHREERTRALRLFLDDLGPTAPDFSEFLNHAQERDLNEEEVRKLLTEYLSGVAALQKKARIAFEINQVTIDNLIPSILGYFEQFCGPSPGDIDPEMYVRTILPQYRQALLHRDLTRGLDICLQGALRDDLMPGAWTEYCTDDILWEALTTCNPWRDPFALLGALDIALARQHDERYQRLAEQAIQQLTQEDFLRPDGIDVYELLPLWANLILNHLNMLEGGALRSPYWKRLCAWMQAGFLCHLMQRLTLDLASLREWVQRNQMLAGAYAKIIDLRHEPMYHASEISRRVLCEETVRRLVQIRHRHLAAGRTFPGSDKVDQAMRRLTERGSPLGWGLPGPLEGHRRPSLQAKMHLSEDYLKWLVAELSQRPSTPILSTLAYLSQRFDLGEELLVQRREVVGPVEAGEATDLIEQISCITEASIIACAQRDGELANTVTTAVVAMAQKAHTELEIAGLLQALLLASSAFHNEAVWAEWLEKRLVDIALRLPAGQPSQLFCHHLGELKKVLPLHLGMHNRAEAIASAAA